MNTQFDLTKATDVDCIHCGCIYFRESYRMKKSSGLLDGSGKDKFAPIQTFRCDDCGAPLETTKPKTQLNG